uniref:Uncharacterized protein n=1 Tax=Skeletonema virus LDF-2015a TaxID=1769778 RepID=A0A1B1IHV4_9VIRU|nr:hypothetical protein AUR56_00015 [Skeletonema virus LDF-2015a]
MRGTTKRAGHRKRGIRQPANACAHGDGVRVPANAALFLRLPQFPAPRRVGHPVRGRHAQNVADVVDDNAVRLALGRSQASPDLLCEQTIGHCRARHDCNLDCRHVESLVKQSGVYQHVEIAARKIPHRPVSFRVVRGGVQRLGTNPGVVEFLCQVVGRLNAGREHDCTLAGYALQIRPHDVAVEFRPFGFFL